MATLFENYEQQYSVLTADITAQIGRLPSADIDDRRQLASDIDKHVEEAQELLEQMELEVIEINPSQRQWCKSKLDCYRAELKRLTLEYSKTKTKIASGYESVDEYSDIRLPEEQKQRLLDNSEKIERSGKKLEEGYRIILETQAVGANILQDLDHQRETIQKSRDRLRDANEDLGQSSRILNAMFLRSIQQRIVLFIVGACIVGVIVLGVYLSFTKS